MTVLVQQTVVHAPGVDAKGIQLAIAALLEFQQTLLELVEKIGSVPVEHAIHFNVVVFKAVQLVHRDLLTVKLA